MCLSLTVVILSTLIITLDYYNRHRELERFVNDKSDEYINFISNTLSIPIWDIDKKSVEHIGRSYSTNDFVSSLIIKNSSDEILYQFSKKNQKDIFTKKKRVVHENYVIGYVEMSFSLEYYQAKIKGTLSTSIIVTLVILTTLISSTGIFLRRILKTPLNMLIDGSIQIASGDYRYRFEDLKYREIKDLAIQFSLMAKQIEEREKRLEDEIMERMQTEEELRSYRDHLEELVGHRTRELTQLNQQLQLAIDETRAMATQAEQANQAKSEFLANMSHELRTPLHIILSSANLGLKRATTASVDRLSRYFQKIDHNGHTLLRLVDDLLDLAKLEVGKMTFDFQPRDLRILCDVVVEEFTTLMAERAIDLHYTRPTVETMASVDDQRWMQVLRNVLSNAVKFSPNDSTVSLSALQEQDVVKVTVRDHGPGIPPEEIETIFDKFIQASSTKTGAGGTGLGLAISREIIHAHSGRIWAENAPEIGTIFTIETPLLSTHLSLAHDAQ